MLKEKEITIEELEDFLYEKTQEIEKSWSNDLNFKLQTVRDLCHSKEWNEEWSEGNFLSDYEHGSFYTILYSFSLADPFMALDLQKGAMISQEEAYDLFLLLLD